jgi:hypothetical protein
MNETWQTKTRCRKCAAPLQATAEPGASSEPALGIFYCPACGERTQLEIPAGYDPLTVSVTPDEG